jgi:hypothetical protein
MRLPVAVVVYGLVVLLGAGCGGGGNAPASVARRYEKAILSRDGDTLCATFAPKLREVVTEQLASESSTSGPRLDCGRFYHLLIGYPHENIERRFVSGKLLSVGKPHQVTRAGVAYVAVPAKLRYAYVYTGYSMQDGKRDSATFDDKVWLAKKDGKWGLVKPSLALLVAAGSPDVLDESYAVAKANATPPDPDYSMNRAERTAWEKADFRRSFRRTIGHAPLRCASRSVSVPDPLHDAVTYPTGSGLHPVVARGANDIARVAVQVAGRRLCVTVTFRKKPAGRLRIDFTSRSRHALLPDYVVELVPSLGVRGGGLAEDYRYFRGGAHLNRNDVDEISLYGRTIVFVADTQAGHPRPGVSAGLEWSVRLGARSGSDEVPNRTPTEYKLIRQSDGRVVKP